MHSFRSLALVRRAPLLLAAALAVVVGGSVPVRAQEPGRFLGREEIRLLGLGMRVEPAVQTVPKDIATIVSTFLQLPSSQAGDVSPFPPGTVLKGTLRGPSLTAPLALTATPNTPFTIPPLSVPGTHTLDEIRLETDGQVLMRGTPESVTINVIEKLLVTQVTTRPLTAQEIRDKGIVYDRSSFQAYNFTAAFAVQDHPVQLSFPVVLPRTVQTPTTTGDPIVTLGGLQAPQAPKLATIIPDTLEIQRAIPNLSVVGFILSLEKRDGQELLAPPIPGVVVIPGQIGFLNQFFSVLLMVGNAAPNGSGLTVGDLRGDMLLPAGRSGVVGADDAPLRLARMAAGAAPAVQPLVQPGPDGKTGTADDIPSIAPGDSASAEYLVEGMREGTHTIEFAISGVLSGLPGGPTKISGRAAGSVLVRNPSFTLTFTHPDTVQAGEPYALDVTVTNTSASIANIVSVALSPQFVSGATVVGDGTQAIDTLAPQDSATVSFSLVSQVSGRVFAATLDGDNVNGRFALKTGVGELDVPVSPDSLVLPAEASSLPADLRKATLGLLGKAWSVATAPSAALPSDIARFSKKIVYDRAIEVAEAGFRHTLHEGLDATVTHLLFDLTGNNFDRLGSRTTSDGERAFAQGDYAAFDELRRRSVRGDVFARAIGGVLGASLGTNGAEAFHRQLAERVSWRASSLSVLASTEGAGPLPVRIVLIDGSGRATGRPDATGKIVKAIPFSDVVELGDAGESPSAALSLISSLPRGAYRIVLEPRAGIAPTPYTLSIVYPDASGMLRQTVFSGVTAAAVPAIITQPSDPWRVTVEYPGAAATPMTPVTTAAIVEPAPSVQGIVQQRNADIVTICPGPPPLLAFGARIVAVLFNKEMPPESVQDSAAAVAITRYSLADNQVVGVAQQPGRRIVFLALRDPIGPYVPRSITFSDIDDGRGNQLTSEAIPIEATVDHGGVVTGRVLQADGSPLAGADVRLVYTVPGNACAVTISARPAAADGSFSWDYVARPDRPGIDSIRTFDPATGDPGKVDFAFQRDGQRLNVNVVLLGRGTFLGRAVDDEGQPLEGTSIRLTSLTDATQIFGATSDANGRFTVSRVPVGNVLVEAVHGGTNARVTLTERIPFAGATITRDLVLLKESVTKITVKFGRLAGRVLLADGASPVGAVPVVVYYQSGSQAGVPCPATADEPSPAQCPVATMTTDQAGAFAFAQVPAGQHRVEAFNTATLQRGEARVLLPADGETVFNLLLAAGLGTVRGIVVDALGAPVAAASVGGGLTLTTTGADGRFVLTDVPVGHLQIVAVSAALGTKGTATIDILQAGQEVNVTVALDPVASVAGRVFEAGGVTPVAGLTVYLFTKGTKAISVAATAVTDAAGRYTMSNVPLNAAYRLSAFLSDFSDGNVIPAPLRFSSQVLRGDIVFRGRGSIVGTVTNANGTAKLRANVGVSGDRVTTAGGVVGTAFEYVKNFAVTQSNFDTGAYAFSGVFVGDFTLQAVGAFSPDPINASGSIPASGATAHVDLRLTATSKITGIVVQPDGATPVGRNVIVRFKSEAFHTVCTTDGSKTTCVDVPQGIREENAVTDDSGHFEVPLVDAGRFTLTAEDPVTGLAGQIRGQVAPGQTGDFTVRLLTQATLTINVRRNDGHTPIPSARVEVRQIAYPRKTLVRTADANGTLVLAGGDAFAEGDMVVTAADLSSGFGGRATGHVANGNSAVTINVFLFDAAGSVSGQVRRSDGLSPVPNADVVISNTRGPLAFAQTDAAGQYQADVIPRGAFTVEVFEPATARVGYETGQITFDQEAVVINVTLAAVGAVSGHVLTAGTLVPLSSWNVALVQTGPSGRQLPSLMATTGLDGLFAFPGVSQGAFGLMAQRTGVAAIGSAQGRLAEEGDVVDLPIIVSIPTPEFGRIEGTVVDANGAAMSNAQVRLCTGACNSPSVGYQEFNLTAAVDGSFAVDQVRVGRVEILVKSPVNQNGGRATAQLAFDGDITHVTVVLVGLARVSGTARLANNNPAAGVRLELSGNPSSGCGGVCTTFADPAGRFEFLDVPARTVTITATDPISGRQGIVVANVTPGPNEVVVVLQPAARLTGRVLTTPGTPAQGITAELQSGLFGGSGAAFATSDASGSFAFSGLANGSYVLQLTDPLGPGVAKRIIQITGDVSFGDVTLDDAGPSVASVDPIASALAVPLEQRVRLVFSEPLDPASVTAVAVTLSGPLGAVASTIALSQNDTVVTMTPLARLAEATRYATQVTGVRDRVGKSITPSFVAGFTTVDLTPPTTREVSPPPSSTGVGITTTVRLAYSEAINPALFAGPPIAVSKGGTAIAGRIDYALDHAVVVFTPARPLEVGGRYDVVVLAASDASGNRQPGGLAFSFTTSDLTPPRILSLTAASPTVIEGTSDTVTADVGQADVAVVDFYINDAPAFASRTRPFALRFDATSVVGRPGDHVKISAIASDTSGLRGTTPAVTYVDIIADQPPTAVIASPADGTSVHNGDRVTVTIRGVDDVGVAQIAYRPGTGRALDAASRSIAPSATDRTESFGFTVPDTLAPGTTIEISATAVDTKGQQTPASVVRLTILDATRPTLSITGTSSGTLVRPGADALAIVAADDAGGVASIRFRATGVVSFDETRPITLAQPSVAASFAFRVPPTARPTDTIRLDATATDRAGNSSDAAAVILSIADLDPPRVSLHTLSGRNDAVIGSTVTVVVDAEDEVAVTRVDLRGSGAFTLADGRSVSPPRGSTSERFDLPIPAGARPDDVLTIEAVARDVFGNVSAPVSLALMLRTLTDVSLPSSVIVLAGESATIPVEISPAAGASGVSVKLTSATVSIATVASPIAINAGETAGSTTVSGVAGGSTAVTASILGVDRASMTVTVVGAVISGTVFDTQFQPVSGAQVSIAAGNDIESTTTDVDGHYQVVRDFGFATDVSVRVFDGQNKRLGVGTGRLNAPRGFVHLNVVVLSVGSISGAVRLPSGTPAPAGARVDLFEQHGTLMATETTANDGIYRFDNVGLGTYVVEASDGGGNRGRATVTIDAGGQQPIVPVTYLGRGSVVGTVRNSGGQAVNTAVVRLFASSIFGEAPLLQRTVALDGTFRFDGVFIGTVTVQATDQTSGLAGVTTGAITQDGQILVNDVTLASFGTVSGIVYRADRATTVPNAQVTLESGGRTLFTLTDAQGRYSFATVPFGDFTVVVRHQPTRGVGRAPGHLSAQGEQVTTDVVMMPQGRIIVTVLQSGGGAASGASVSVVVTAPLAYDAFTATADQNGVGVLDNVIAGAFTLTARAGALSGTASGTLAADETAQVTITLEPTGSLAGTVYQPDRVTPAPAGTVTIQSLNDTSAKRVVDIGVDGTYRADGLPLQQFRIVASDGSGRPRAIARTSLSAQGATVTQDATFTALGTVTGTVINPGGTRAGSLGVTLRSQNPDFGGYFFVTTNAAGIYQFDNVYAGPVVVTTAAINATLGEASGAVTIDGATVTLDIQLTPNAVRFPMTKYDGSNVPFDIQANGATQYGLNGVFTGNYPDPGGAFILDIVSGGVATRFTGADIGNTELAGNQLVTRQNGIAGLNVTRKIFVPRSHFARYLELLSNPTTAPITVSVRVGHSLVPYGRLVSTVATSSGDTTLGVGDPANPDRWIVASIYDDVDPFLQNTWPTLAWAFDGAGGRRRVTTATIGPATTGFSSGGRLTYEWSDVTIPPGAVVGLMHFGVQQVSRAAARASAARLDQLPPEALDGLSPLEVAAIENFNVPASGISTLAPLPPLAGTVTGRVFEADSVTPLKGLFMQVRSTVPVFARSYRAFVNSDGSYRAATGNDPTFFNGWIGIPIAPFTVNAQHPQTTVSSPVFGGVDGPTVTGTFPPGETSATANYAFTNTAMVRVKIRRANGAVVIDPNGSISANRIAPAAPPSVSSSSASGRVAPDGTYPLYGLLPGTYQLYASVSSPQLYGYVTATTTVTVAVGDVKPIDITLPATGSLTGTLRNARGAPIASSPFSVVVSLRDSLTPNYWNASVNVNGVFLFADVPAGRYSLEARDDQTGLTATVPVTILANQTVTQDISYIATGTVTGRVFDRSGAPMADQQVSLRSANNTFLGANTDAAGRYTITPVLTGDVIVATYDPNSRLLADARGRIAADGDTQTIDLRFQGVPLPAALVDGNNFEFDVDTDGRLTGSTDAYAQGYYLSLFAKDASGNPQQLGFPTRNSAGTELDDRQLVIGQSPFSFGYPPGLLMTRKVFVPRNGYFARFLEVFENTGTAPLNVDVQINVGLRSGGSTMVLDTSSGDQTFDPTDRWLITDKASTGLPVLAHVFAGPNAALTPSTVGFGYGNSFAYGPFYRWNGLTLQPGQKAVLMHFAVQQFDMTGARASVDRLELLPPEALAGLTADDIAAIRTFAVPADGSSPLAPLADAQETITATGRVFAQDGATPLAGALVTFGSASGLYGALAMTTADAAGNFKVTGRAVDHYRLQATHPLTGALSPATSDVVVPGETTLFRNIVFTNTGALRGIVRTEAGTPLPGAIVDVFGPASTFTVEVIAGADGRFLVSGLASGTYSVTAWAGGRSTIVDNVVVTAGGTTTQDVIVAADARLRIDVRDAAGLQLRDAYVYYQLEGESFLRYAGQIGDGGAVTSGNVPKGGYTVVAYDLQGGIIGRVTGTVTAADEGRTINVIVQAVGTGGIDGRVVAGDQQTPVPYASIDIVDVATGEAAAFGSTDADGLFSVRSVNHGAQGVRVVASAGGKARAQGSASFTSPGQKITVDLVLPAAVVRASVYRADGATPATDFQLSVGQPGEQGRVNRQFPNVAGASVTLFLDPGPFSVRPTDARTGAGSSVSGTIVDVATVQTLTMLMPATGTIDGVVRDGSGAPLAFATVVASTNGGDNDLYESTDGSGAFHITGVPLGAFTVESCEFTAITLCGSSIGTLSSADQTITSSIVLPQTGQVQGRTWSADGVTPASGRFDYVRVLGGIGGPLNQGTYVSVFEMGQYGATVPVGPVTAVLLAGNQYGHSNGTLTPTAPLTLDVVLDANGATTPFTSPPAGADNVAYRTACSGAIRGGEDLTPYELAYALRVNGTLFDCASAATSEAGGRQIAYGPYPLAGLQVTRRVFVPAAGGFARFLESFTNPGATAIEVDVKVESTWSGIAGLFVAPDETNRTYAVTEDGTHGASGRAVGGHVFAGFDATAPPIAVEFQPFLGPSLYRYRVTVPAGGTATLMHFAVQRAGGDAAGANAQASSLANLTDPGALAEMSAEEKARVINFRIQ